MQQLTLYFFKYLYTNCSHLGCDSGWASEHLSSVNTLAQPRESILLLGIPSHPNSTYSLTVNTRTCIHERRLTSPAIHRHEDRMAMDFSPSPHPSNPAVAAGLDSALQRIQDRGLLDEMIGRQPRLRGLQSECSTSSSGDRPLEKGQLKNGSRELDFKLWRRFSSQLA